MKTPMRVLLSVLVTMALASSGVAATLYSFAHGGAEPTPAALRGATVRFIGQSEFIVEADERFGGDRRAEGFLCEELVELTEEDVAFICYPRARDHSLAVVGDVVWSEPDGAVLVIAPAARVGDLRSRSFMCYPLPERMDPTAWFDETPPAGALPRGDESALRGFVDDVLDAVSSDTLMAHVERLSQYPGGESRTRYIYRDECLDEAAAYIVGRLESYGVVVDTQAFTRLGYTCEQGIGGPPVDYPLENITGILPGDGRLSGCYVVGAHYDAIASYSFPDDSFWWCDNAAPGADDNATGVATVLEAARVLASSGGTFPFDIRFALFTAEEQGLIGSDTYSDSLAAAGDTVYAILNVDMIAYKRQASDPDTCHIVTNPATRWFADWIIDTTTGAYAGAFPDFVVERIDKALAYSDHGSFWVNGYDGLVAIEHFDPRDRNVNYHTIDDRLDTVFASQLASTARMCIGAMARMVDPEGTFNIAVFGTDVDFTPDYVSTDASVEVTVDAHAYGPPEDVSLTLEVWDGRPDEGTLLDAGSFAGLLGGGEYVTHTFTWEPSEDDVGEHTLWVRAVTDGAEELSLNDNADSTLVTVTAPRLFVTDHFAWPNPVESVSDLGFRYELSRDAAAADIDVFDVTGQRIATWHVTYDQSAGDAGNAGLLAGWNDVSWSVLDGAADEPASGVYVYRLAVWESGATDESDIVTGKIALVR